MNAIDDILTDEVYSRVAYQIQKDTGISKTELLKACPTSDTGRRYGLRHLFHSDYSFQHEAKKQFGELNGWKLGADGPLGKAHGFPNNYPRWRKQYSGGYFNLFDWMPDGIWDHGFCYRKDRRVAAMVAQPYSDPKMEKIRFRADIKDVEKWAAENGCVVHFPPHPFASLHYPGWTIFLVFTLPGVVPQWLPEQINGLKRTEQQIFDEAKDILGRVA